MRKDERNKLFIAGGIFAGVLAALIWWCVINIGQAIELTILFVLVLVTTIYAKRTAEIAGATKEQAKEMREQRYDAVRPVIDIKPREPQPIMLNIEEVTNKEKEEAEYLSGLRCALHNIGIGPATDVYSFTLTVGGERIQKDFGILTTKGETTPDVLLSPERRDEQWFLVAHYRDVYGRCFESSREISLDKEKNAWSIGPLKIRKIAKEELPK